MNRKILQQAERYKRGYRLKRIRKRILTVLSAIVVFITTYMLILPAITVGNDVYCGSEEHEHTDSCYERVAGSEGSAELICSPPIHNHSEECYDEEENLICGISELVIHTHNEYCYYGGELICTLDEVAEHTHDELCYLTEETVICGIEDGEHTHTEECIGQTTTLTCTLPEIVLHRHGEECYVEECIAKDCTHEECTETQMRLVCTKILQDEHLHTADCLHVTEPQDESVRLICGLEEHVHTLSCSSDPTADVEDEDAWTSSFGDLTLSGRPARDILAIAKSQLGYSESTKNYAVREDGVTLDGYTRYGEWNSTPYAEWNTLFVSFCAYYSNAGAIPETAELGLVVDNVLAGFEDLYKTPDSYRPAAGDVAILDTDDDSAADRIGIVSEYSLTQNTLTLIEGDVGGRVAYVTYEMDDSPVSAYVQLSDPTLDYSTDGYSSLNTAGTVMYHSIDQIDYQYSSHRVTGSDGQNFMTLTYVLIPYDQLDGWEPNVLNWHARAGANYVVAYCADRDTDVIDESDGVAGETYVTQEIEGSAYEDHAAVLSGIVEHSYPFITADEMRNELRLAYENGETEIDLSCCTESEFIAAAQWAIWDMTGLSEPQVGATGATFPIYNSDALNPLSDPGHTDEATIDSHVSAIRDWLVTKRAAVRLNVADHSSTVTRNGDGTYDVIVTVHLDRALEDKEVLNVLLASGDHSYEMTCAEMGTTSFEVSLTGLTPAEVVNAEVTLSVSIEHMQVYVYDSERFQDMISGRWGRDEYQLDFPIDVATTSVDVTKLWADGQPGAESVEVQLFADGTEYGAPVILNESNGWKHSWDRLLKYSADGVEIDYTVRELPIPEYLSTVERLDGGTALRQTLTEVDHLEEGGSYVITYEQTNAMIDDGGYLDWARGVNTADPNTLPASALWTASSVSNSGSCAYLQNAETDSYLHFDGSNIAVGSTPSAAYYLYEHFYFLSGINNRYLTYLNGGMGYITDDWDSALAVKFYKLTETDTRTSDISYVITNTKTAEYTSVTVKKEWAGKSDGIYPESVTVELLCNGTAYGAPIVLNGDNDWSHTWERLPLELDGVAFEYTVKETETEHYTPSVTKTQTEDGVLYTIVNTYDRIFIPLKLVKVDMSDPTIRIPGAEFELYAAREGPRDGLVTIPQTDSVTGELIATITVAADGSFTIEELEAGFTYYLIEKRAPQGYNKLKIPVVFRVEKQEDGKAAVIPITENDVYLLTRDERDVNVLKIKNPKGYLMPSTGGEGIYPYTIGGTALIAAALILLFYKQNKRRKERANSS